MEVYLLRHGLTAGNEERRYIGRTDEGLSDEGRRQIERLKEQGVPELERLVCSPMRRCIETAEILFPGRERVICEELREIDFGAFEGKNYAELNGNPDYQRWIDSGGTLPFPGGEDPADFRRRCCEGFSAVIEDCSKKNIHSVFFIVHGGTIMSVMEKFALPHKDYFSYHCPNGQGYRFVMRLFSA